MFKKALEIPQISFPVATGQKTGKKLDTALNAVPTRSEARTPLNTELVLYHENIQMLTKVIGTAVIGPAIIVKFTQNTVSILNAFLTGIEIEI